MVGLGFSDEGETRNRAASDFNMFAEHEMWSNPEPALSVQSLVDHDALASFSVLSHAEHAVVVSFIVTVAARTRIGGNG